MTDSDGKSSLEQEQHPPVVLRHVVPILSFQFALPIRTFQFVLSNSHFPIRNIKSLWTNHNTQQRMSIMCMTLCFIVIAVGARAEGNSWAEMRSSCELVSSKIRKFSFVLQPVDFVQWAPTNSSIAIHCVPLHIIATESTTRRLLFILNIHRHLLLRPFKSQRLRASDPCHCVPL